MITYFCLDGANIDDSFNNNNATHAINTMGYGSFTASEPDIHDHNYHYKDPRKIILREQDGEIQFQYDYFYISFESITDVKISASVKPYDSEVERNRQRLKLKMAEGANNLKKKLNTDKYKEIRRAVLDDELSDKMLKRMH
jgi:hypothetical protein